MNFSEIILPLIVLFIIVYGLFKGVDIFKVFLEGAKDGLKSAYEICPALVILLVSIGVFRASGAVDTLTNLISPITAIFMFPEECIPLILLRPVSGSGSLALVEDILKNHGADSIPGITASILMSSTETTFYAFAMYFSVVKVQKTRHTILACLTGDMIGWIATAIVVRLMFI